MDTLRDALNKRYVARDSQLRRLSQLCNSVDEVGERAHATLAADSDDWAIFHVIISSRAPIITVFFSVVTMKWLRALKCRSVCNVNWRQPTTTLGCQ
jgi:hypothetical protein